MDFCLQEYEGGILFPMYKQKKILDIIWKTNTGKF